MWTSRLWVAAWSTIDPGQCLNPSPWQRGTTIKGPSHHTTTSPSTQAAVDSKLQDIILETLVDRYVSSIFRLLMTFSVCTLLQYLDPCRTRRLTHRSQPHHHLLKLFKMVNRLASRKQSYKVVTWLVTSLHRLVAWSKLVREELKFQ